MLYERDIDLVFWNGGEVGVSVFYLISGFLTHQTIFKIDLQGWKKWFLHKILRLYPTFAISVIIIFALLKLFELPGRDDVEVKTLFYNLFLLPVIGGQMIDSAHWYLFGLIKLYIFFIFLHKLGIESRWELQIIIFIVFLILTNIGNGYICYALLLNGHVKSVCLGWSLSLSLSSRETKINFLPIFVWLSAFYIGSSIITSIVISFIVISFICSRLQTIVENRVLISFNTISYSWYLIHQNIGFMIIYNTSGIMCGDLAVLLAAITTMSLSILIYTLVEKPCSNFFCKKIAI